MIQRAAIQSNGNRSDTRLPIQLDAQSLLQQSQQLKVQLDAQSQQLLSEMFRKKRDRDDYNEAIDEDNARKASRIEPNAVNLSPKGDATRGDSDFKADKLDPLSIEKKPSSMGTAGSRGM